MFGEPAGLFLAPWNFWAILADLSKYLGEYNGIISDRNISQNYQNKP